MMFLSLIIPLVPLLIFILMIVFVIRAVHRMERRAEERLKLDKESATLQHKQIQDINDRLTNIENMLKEVE
ncbi:hypothetical protein [Sporolactobacillus pectinivorans]|uniref:hypothetical protein n=1 Tax=Sporolactobacillus pectinivorans TaxID=1591408 RepID=UPI000C25B8BA|nr:hypothetical protein [Sporolactobacillus pectinivorans]